MKYLWIVAMVLGLGACATVAPPPADTLPIVRFGSPAPANDKFVLHFPAGSPIPTKVSITGNAFVKAAEDELTVALKRDIYSYKEWVSFDRKAWVKADDALTLQVEIKLPGHAHPLPGSVKIHMDLK